MTNRSVNWKRVASLPRPRKGSILVLVVALLVLLALMGTAYLTTVRIDRAPITGTGSGATVGAGAWISADETSMDASLTQAKGLVTQAILDDVLIGGSYRLPSATYRDYTSPVDSQWLASRLPEPASGGNVRWPYISGWLGAFSSPYSATAGNLPAPPPRQNLEAAALVLRYPKSTGGGATTPGFTTPDALSGRTRVYPALKDPVSGQVYMAADADGDGIADSALFSLATILSTNIEYATGTRQVKYFAAVRIIDNNAAINANTAFSRDCDFVCSADPRFWLNPIISGPDRGLLGCFRSNVGLLELLDPTMDAVSANTRFNEILSLNQFRFGASGAGAVNGGPTVFGDLGPRIDFTFATVGDAMEMQLARRLAYPGYNAGNTTNDRYRPLPAETDVSLAYRFGLVNPEVTRTALEQRMIYSAYGNAANFAANNDRIFKYYPANAVDHWFNATFNFNAALRTDFYGFLSPAITPAPPRAIRPLLVANNGVANSIPAPTMGGIANNIEKTPYASADTYPDLMPDYDTDRKRIGKTCVNTAKFGELWRAFWCVMGVEGPGSALPPQYLKANNPRANARMFRSSIRTVPGWEERHQLLLRAALAAVNTMDLRDSDDDVTSKKVTLYDGNSTNFDVVVYGTERQPYTTQMVVETDNTGVAKFVVLELFNPYPLPITLNNWKLLILDRAAVPMTPTVLSLPALTIPARLGAGTGYVAFQDGTSPTNIIVPGGQNLAGLLGGVGKEIVLVRPRRADGTQTAGADYNELDPNPIKAALDMVPIDQIDTRNVPPAPGATPAPTIYRYARPTGDLWQCVYPGAYDAAGAQPTLGFKAVPSVSFGTDDPAGTINPIFTIRLNGKDWPGPTRLIDPATGAAMPPPYKFPFGGFARDGDILQVPFIGGYRVRQAGDAANTVRELNSVTMDAFYAEDDDATDDAAEQVGRFCPIGDPLTSGGDYNSTTPAAWRYRWAMRLFDYLTAIHNPKDDYLPNTDPMKYVAAGLQEPQKVSNAGAVANVGEDATPIEGLININTASWKVLSMLPLVLDGTTGAVDGARTEQLARAIVADRDTNGAFRTIFDLNRVPGFQDALAQLPAEPDGKWGELAPATVPGIVDFRRKYLQMTRISNLITTRSDSFTCYVLIQAWQDAVTPLPVLVGERRSAFIIDRSGINDIDKTIDKLKITPVPTN